MTASDILSRSAGGAMTAFGAELSSAAADATAILKAVRGLPTPDGLSYGRYFAGQDPLVPYAASATDIDSLVAQGVTLRQAASVAIAAAITAASSSAFPADVFAACEAVRQACADPGDALRLFAALTDFAYTPPAPGSDAEGVLIGEIASASVMLMQRASAVSLARASADYTPNSQQDAASQRDLVADALDRVAEAAADVFDDESAHGLDNLRVAVALDLTARGASLAPVVTRTFAVNLPADVLAYKLYQDADRAGELLARNGPPHPSFMPTQIEALAN